MNRLESTEIFLALIRSEAPSLGMKMELAEAIKQNKIIVLAIKKGLGHQEFRVAAHHIVESDSEDELIRKIILLFTKQL